jgi:hypothetical protein
MPVTLASVLLGIGLNCYFDTPLGQWQQWQLQFWKAVRNGDDLKPLIKAGPPNTPRIVQVQSRKARSPEVRPLHYYDINK